MCGIIGYVGANALTSPDTLEVLLNGLNGLEYRGYDSAGVALSNGSLEVYKHEGQVSNLESMLPQSAPDSVGIGHTRWSTHGPPSDRNAHPHTDTHNRVAVVHNGIIENYEELKTTLQAQGVTFESDTDTEVVPHLIAAELEAGADEETAFRRAIDQLEGSYAIAAVFADSETIYAARHESPLVIGVSDEGNYLASDVPAFIRFTDRVIYIDDGQFVTLDRDSVTVTDSEGHTVETKTETISWSPEDAGKSGYDHYMLKEIHEQPAALRGCLRGRVNELERSITLDSIPPLEWEGPIMFVACGTSYHATLGGVQLLEERGMHAVAYQASEFEAARRPVGENSLVIAVTQSGETADTMRAMREANRVGATTVAVTNVVGSSASREADHVLYIRAGPEIGVAATKTFASQQAAMVLLASALHGEIDPELVQALRTVPDSIQTILDTSDAKAVAETYADADAYFFIGRGPQYPVALEGALKMKEITYKHAEGFAAGELKHGPLALVTDNTPVFATVIGDGPRARKTIGNIKEVEARSAPVVAITDGRSDVARYADHVLEVPEADDVTGSMLANVQLQLVSYWVAHGLGRSIDKPRNLAKSVTVE